MPINDIVAEQARRGEIEPELAQQVAGRQGRAMAQQGAGRVPQNRQPRRRRGSTPSLDAVTQLEKTDIQMWVDIGILVMLFLIWARL